MHYEIKTDLDTISQAWTLLDEIGLAGLLVNQKLEVKAEELLAQLFAQRKLIQFLAIITHQDEQQMAALGLTEAVEVIADFFTSIAGTLAAFGGLGLSGKLSPAIESSKG